MVIAWGLQAVLYMGGIFVGDLNDYIFWQFLSVLAGVLLAVGFFMVTKVPYLLRLKASYADSWIRFAVFMAVFLLAQLLYNFWPVPESPGGLIGTMMLHVGIVIAMWWWYSLASGDVMVPTSVNGVVFQGYLGRNYMFGLWAIVLFSIECMFFLTYATLSDKLTVYAAAALGAFILIAFAAVYPLNPAYVLTPFDTASNSTPLILRGNDYSEDAAPPYGGGGGGGSSSEQSPLRGMDAYSAEPAYVRGDGYQRYGQSQPGMSYGQQQQPQPRAQNVFGRKDPYNEQKTYPVSNGAREYGDEEFSKGGSRGEPDGQEPSSLREGSFARRNDAYLRDEDADDPYDDRIEPRRVEQAPLPRTAAVSSPPPKGELASPPGRRMASPPFRELASPPEGDRLRQPPRERAEPAPPAQPRQTSPLLAAVPPTPVAVAPPTPVTVVPPTPVAVAPPTPIAVAPPTPVAIVTDVGEGRKAVLIYK